MLRLRFRCFGSGNPLWTSIGSDASTQIMTVGGGSLMNSSTLEVATMIEEDDWAPVKEEQGLWDPRVRERNCLVDIFFMDSLSREPRMKWH
ncbi:hypothetical protein V6N13_082099 [Hibiscus sabdariffa]